MSDAPALGLNTKTPQPGVEAPLGPGMKPLRGKECQKMENEKWKMFNDK